MAVKKRGGAPSGASDGRPTPLERWQERVAQNVIPVTLINRMIFITRYELNDAMQAHLQLNFSAHDLKKLDHEQMQQHCTRFSQLILGCLIDERKREPIPSTWEELESRLETARNIDLPTMLRAQGIDISDAGALQTVQTLFAHVAEGMQNRAKFDREAPEQGTYLQ